MTKLTFVWPLSKFGTITQNAKQKMATHLHVAAASIIREH